MLTTTAITEIRARLQELTADFWTSTEVLNAINEGLRRFSSQEKWEWLFTEVTNVSVTASQDTIDLVAGVSAARHFNLGLTFAGDSMVYIPRRVSAAEGFRLRQRYVSDSAYPTAFYITKATTTTGVTTTTIRLVPVLTRAATAIYQYIRDPAVATGAAEHMDIPDEYAMAVVAYATGTLWLKELRDSRKADEQFALFWQIVDDAKRESRKLSVDSGVAWGSNQPQGFVPSETDEAYRLLGGRVLG